VGEDDDVGVPGAEGLIVSTIFSNTGRFDFAATVGGKHTPVYVFGGGGSLSDTVMLYVRETVAVGESAWFQKAEHGGGRGFTSAPGRESLDWHAASPDTDGMARGRITIDAQESSSFTGPIESFPRAPLATDSASTDQRRVCVALYVDSVSGVGPTLDVTVRSSPTADFATSTVRMTFDQVTATGIYWQEARGPISDEFWRVDGTIGGSSPAFRIIAAIGVGKIAAHRMPPAIPTLVAPANGATDIFAGLLSWSDAVDDINGSPATSYDVNFGTTNPPPRVSTGQAGASLDRGLLASSTTFYWQVVARNAFGTTAGPIWSFTTIAEDSVTVLTSTSTGTLNNFNPGALTVLNVLRMNNASLATIRGLTNNGNAPTDGTMVWIEAVGAGQVDIANQDAASTAANRIINNVTAPISLAAGSGRALLCYDGTTARWRVLEHTQGAAITPTFAAGNFGAGGAMTWTVDSGDVVSFSYELRGRILNLGVLVAEHDRRWHTIERVVNHSAW
jgi:hypothetical protein